MLTIRNIHKIGGERFTIVKEKAVGIIREIKMEQTRYRFMITTLGSYGYRLEFRLERKMTGNGTYMVEVTDDTGKLMSSIIGENELAMKSVLSKIEEMVTTWCISNSPF